MKFSAVVVVLALAFSASASVVPLAPLGLNPLGLNHLGLNPLWNPYGLNSLGWNSLAYSHLGAPLVIQPQAISLSQGLAGPILAPGITLQSARIAAPIAAPIALTAAEGQYVAANRGAIHSAPLPGHIQSVSSTNLEPAPGTL